MMYTNAYYTPNNSISYLKFYQMSKLRPTVRATDYTFLNFNPDSVNEKYLFTTNIIILYIFFSNKAFN